MRGILTALGHNHRNMLTQEFLLKIKNLFLDNSEEEMLFMWEGRARGHNSDNKIILAGIAWVINNLSDTILNELHNNEFYVKYVDMDTENEREMNLEEYKEYLIYLYKKMMEIQRKYNID